VHHADEAQQEVRRFRKAEAGGSSPLIGSMLVWRNGSASDL
jgi:hypothetical protein